MPAPRWLARVNLHFTNHILSPFARRLPAMGIVHHTGRRSRREYRTPVMVFRRGPRFVIALTYGRDSQWVRNVLAAGGCRIETEGRTISLRQPRLVHDESRREMPQPARTILGLLNVSDFLEMEIEQHASLPRAA